MIIVLIVLPSFSLLSRKPPKTFAFDHCFYSTDPEASHFASQELVFDNVGRGILENAFDVSGLYSHFHVYLS